MRADGFVTVIIPFREAVTGTVEALLRDETEVGNRPKKPWRDALAERPRLVHFLSMAVVDPTTPMHDDTPASRDGISLLMIEVSSDAGAEETLGVVARALRSLLLRVLEAAKPSGWDFGSSPRDETVARFLLDHSHLIGADWRRALGQVHDGSPAMSVQRVLDEQGLAQRIADRIETLRSAKGQDWLDGSPMQRLGLIRDWLWESDKSSEPTKWAFTPEPAPLLQGEPATGRDRDVKFYVGMAYMLLWPLSILLTFVMLEKFFISNIGKPWPEEDVSWIVSGLFFFAVVVLWWLRRPKDFPFIGLVGPAFGLIALTDPLARVVAASIRMARMVGTDGWVSSVLAELRDQSVPILIAFMDSVWNAIVWTSVTALAIALVTALAVLAGHWLLKKEEESDPVDDHTPDVNQVRSLMRVENYCPQNHMFTISTIKPGLLRWLALRIVFAGIGANPIISRPGFLGKNGVIHSARWLWIRDPKPRWFRWFDPGRLIFWSNFDGTWESYVGDFVADSPDGVTGLWSNCVGFPRARSLIHDGANNRDRLVRWARRQQKPTAFWYSAYPGLTNARIRINAAIRQGIACVETDADARDWLSLFGSQPRPASSLVTSQIPTLVFGGLKSLPHATCYMIRLSDDASTRSAWLRHVRTHVTFGELLPGQTRAVALAFAVSALRRIGLPEDAISTFPIPFQEGMSTKERARLLGDDNADNRPTTWRWGGTEAEGQVDVLLLLYGKSPDDVAAEARQLRVADQVIVDEQQLRFLSDAPSAAPCATCGEAHVDAPAAPQDFRTELFGFVDGLSQPVIRGLRRSDDRAAYNDLVNPGEFVLGYPDNLPRIPPTPLLDPKDDPDHLLADEEDVALDAQRPEFSRNRAIGRRDLGMNGSFLVVRQLEQHVDRWKALLERASTNIWENYVTSAGDGGAAIVWGDPTTDVVRPGSADDGSSVGRKIYTRATTAKDIEPAIAAKLIGRWQNGSPLVRCPMAPGPRSSIVDNSFRFGVEDPQGIACPLGAHTRRANPRDTRFPKSAEEIASVNRHRMLRIGRPYTKRVDGKTERGLMFMCLNADIERQFEFVQKSWLLNANMSGLENEVDPLLGGRGDFSIPTPRGIVKLKISERLVTVHGGGYFFMPGLATLNFLARFGDPTAPGLPSEFAGPISLDRDAAPRGDASD